MRGERERKRWNEGERKGLRNNIKSRENSSERDFLGASEPSSQ